jgi:hypothetical protein
MAGLGPYGVADGAAVTAAATLTDATPQPAPYLPANFIDEPGMRFDFDAYGHYTTSATAGTLTFGLYTGAIGQAITAPAVIMAVSGSISYVASATNRPWRMEGSFIIRSIGSAGTGIAVMEASNLSAVFVDMATTAAGSTFTVDTTVARYLAIGFNVSTAQSFTCRHFGVRSVN